MGIYATFFSYPKKKKPHSCAGTTSYNTFHSCERRKAHQGAKASWSLEAKAKNRLLSKEKKEEIRYGEAKKSRSALFQSLAPSGRHAPCGPKQHLFEGASPELKQGARPTLRVRLRLSAPEARL